MWIVGTSFIRPLALNEPFDTLCIPTLATSTLMSPLDPISDSTLRIHAKSWLVFHGQIRERCSSFPEVTISQTREFKSSYCENTDQNPFYHAVTS